MPYIVKWPKRGAYKRLYGQVSMKDLLDSLSEVQCHSDFDHFEYTITDFLGVDGFDFNQADANLYAAYAAGGAHTNARLAIGIVANQPAIIQLIKAHYQPHVDYRVAFFETSEACRLWVQQITGVAVEF